MASPGPRFVVVPHRPRARALLVLLVVLWLASLALTWQLSRGGDAAPKADRAIVEYSALREERNELRAELERARREIALARRAEQVMRGANQEVQAGLREREEEIAALRADLAFYERLVGGSAQRQGLTVHSVSMAPVEAGGLHYVVTLTQNLKKTGMTRGALTLQVEGILAGKLTALDWAALRQDADASPQPFAFRYFQQLEGGVMLPAGFVPHRIRVQVDAEGARLEQIFPWSAAQPAAQGA